MWRNVVRVTFAATVAAGLLLSACGSSSSTGATNSTQTPVVAGTPAPLPEPTLLPEPTSEPTPMPTPGPTGLPVLEVAGALEVVFDHSTDACEPEEIPDLAARAFRDVDGVVHLLVSHTESRWMVGPDLDSVVYECGAPALSSDFDPDPAAYSDAEWIASVYTTDGQTVYALVHNEYQGHRHPGQCPSGEYFDCWDNSVTAAVSTDGGATFVDSLAPPGHLVARFPFPYEAGAGPTGFRAPSNIITGPDGLFYVFMNVADARTDQQWVCLMRSDDLADPGAWRFWDGTDFAGRFIDPYRAPVDDQDAHECPALALNAIGASLNDSVVYHPGLGLYVLLGISADHLNGREVWGFYYSFSDDLVHWSRRELLLEVELPWTVDNPGSDLSHLYPSLIDPDSPSLSFETTDDEAYVYFTRNNFGHASLDRDLVRVPVVFSSSASDG